MYNISLQAKIDAVLEQMKTLKELAYLPAITTTVGGSPYSQATELTFVWINADSAKCYDKLSKVLVVLLAKQVAWTTEKAATLTKEDILSEEDLPKAVYGTIRHVWFDEFEKYIKEKTQNEHKP